MPENKQARCCAACAPKAQPVQQESAQAPCAAQECGAAQTEAAPEAGGITTGKTKHRGEDEYQDLICRLNRIEGQVRGVRKMVEEDRYCVDILTQVSAISAALNAFNKVLLAQHIKTCVVNDIRAGHEEVVDELCLALQKLMK